MKYVLTGTCSKYYLYRRFWRFHFCLWQIWGKQSCKRSHRRRWIDAVTASSIELNETEVRSASHQDWPRRANLSLKVPIRAIGEDLTQRVRRKKWLGVTGKIGHSKILLTSDRFFPTLSWNIFVRLAPWDRARRSLISRVPFELF